MRKLLGVLVLGVFLMSGCSGADDMAPLDNNENMQIDLGTVDG